MLRRFKLLVFFTEWISLRVDIKNNQLVSVDNKFNRIKRN